MSRMGLIGEGEERRSRAERLASCFARSSSSRWARVEWLSQKSSKENDKVPFRSKADRTSVRIDRKRAQSINWGGGLRAR